MYSEIGDVGFFTCRDEYSVSEVAVVDLVSVGANEQWLTLLRSICRRMWPRCTGST